MKISVFNARDFHWEEPPGHFGAYSKCIVNEETAGAKRLDFRISRYPIRGRVASHAHADAEQLYYVIPGEGTARAEGLPVYVERGTALFIPPGAEHSLENTGDEDLVFVVVTAQALDVSPTGPNPAPGSGLEADQGGAQNMAQNFEGGSA